MPGLSGNHHLARAALPRLLACSTEVVVFIASKGDPADQLLGRKASVAGGTTLGKGLLGIVCAQSQPANAKPTGVGRLPQGPLNAPSGSSRAVKFPDTRRMRAAALALSRPQG